MNTEEEIATQLFKTNQLIFPPLQIEVKKCGVLIPTSPTRAMIMDIVLDIRWRHQLYTFGAEIRTRYTPQALIQAVAQTRHLNDQSHTYPMVIVPYLNEEGLRYLQEQGVSGLDLCGNGVVVVPNELLVFRTGLPNKYPSSASIKNVYRGDSSLVARVFFARSEYPTVGEIQKETRERGGKIALSTVSKALKSLEEDLLVGRNSGAIRLLQAEKLLDKLSANFQVSKVSRRFQAKYLTDETSVMEALVSNAQANHARCVLTGMSSVNLYAATSHPDKLSLYCTDIDALLSRRGGEHPAPVEETSRFADIELLETQDETVYFDSRQDEKKSRDMWRGKDWLQIWLYGAASPVQTYAELMAGGPREKQIAEQVKQLILNEVGQPKP